MLGGCFHPARTYYPQGEGLLMKRMWLLVSVALLGIQLQARHLDDTTPPVSALHHENADSLIVGWCDVRTFGAKGDSMTDNASAIQAALNYLKTFGSFYVYDRPVLYFPAGHYVCSGVSLDSCEGLRIVGDGTTAVEILSSSSADTIFTFSTFDNPPGSYFQGTVQDVTIENLTLRCASKDIIDAVDTRTGIGIIDNGGGAIHLQNVAIRGFKYGFAAPYGSDFTSMDKCLFVYNDVGVYLGPYSTQWAIHDVDFWANSEDVVLEAARQGHISDCSFIDAKSHAISIDAYSTTRFGISLPAAWAHEYSLAIDNCWFETGTGWAHGNDHWSDIVTRGDLGVAYPSNIKVENCLLYSGESGMGAKNRDSTYAFWDHRTGTKQRLINLVVSQGRIDAVVKIDPSTAPLFEQQNTQFSNWGTLPDLFHPDGVAQAIVTSAFARMGGSSSFSTTDQRKAIYLIGTKSTDYFVVSPAINAAPRASDALSCFAKTDSLIVWRSAGGTSGLSFNWVRIR